MRREIALALIILLVGWYLTSGRREKKSKQDSVNTLLRQAARWSAAAQQDESPIIALLHANYGAGYLWALKDIASDDEIKFATGVDRIVFEGKITAIQDAATKKVTAACPKFVGKLDRYLVTLAGDG